MHTTVETFDMHTLEECTAAGEPCRRRFAFLDGDMDLKQLTDIGAVSGNEKRCAPL